MHGGVSSLDRIANHAECAHTGFVTGSRRRFMTERLPVLLDSSISVVIVLNAIAIGMSCDVAPMWGGWVVVDSGFAAFFLCEIIVQCACVGFRDYFFGVENFWHALELMLVGLAIMEVCINIMTPFPPPEDDDGASTLAMFKVLRLLRIARIARVGRLSLFKELSVLISGTLGGMRTLLFSIFLLAVPLYVFALIFRETLGDKGILGHGAQAFGTLGLSFFTLFRCTVAQECTQPDGRPIFVEVTDRYGWGYGALYSALVFFVTLGLFNVIAAIFVENVVIGAKTSVRMVRRQKLRDKAFYSAKILELVGLILEIECPMPNGRSRRHMSTTEIVEKGKELKLTPSTFEKLRVQRRFGEILSDLDVGDDDQFELFDTLDTDGSGEVDVEELVDGISHLRGEARRSDVVSLNFMLRNSHGELRKTIESHSRVIRHMLRDLAQNMGCSLSTRPLDDPLPSPKSSQAA